MLVNRIILTHKLWALKNSKNTRLALGFVKTGATSRQARCAKCLEQMMLRSQSISVLRERGDITLALLMHAVINGNRSEK